MGRVKKSTRKFMQKKSTGRQVYRKKTDWKRAKASAELSGDGAPKADSEAQLPEELDVAEMDVDEFLAGDFLNEGSDGEEDTDGDDDEAAPNDEAAPSNSDELLSSENEDGADVSSDEAGAAAGRLQHSSQEPNPPSQDNDEDDDDMSDDETGTGVGKQNRRLKDEIAAHRAQLEALKQADPEFYEYLQSTDKELLAFGQGEPESEDEEEEEEELESSAEEQEEEEDAGDRETEAPAAEPVPSEKSMTVTLSMVNSWCSAAKSTASPGSLRQLFRAYRAACHYGDTEDSVDEGLRLGSSAVYSRLMMFVLREADGLLRRALGADDGLTASAVVKMPRWRKIEPLAKSYLGNTLHLLGQMTDAAMLAFVLRRIRASVPFLAPFAKLQRRLLKSALALFGSADAAPRVQAILLIRAMALGLPPPSMDACLKGVYRAFSSNAKFVTATSAPHINFMASCVVEMYGLDASAAYQHAFGFIRQLAVLLRQALTSKAKESYREVYCWQTINCLELWAKVLSAHADSEGLRPLVHPLSQILLGTARLVPTPTYFPLRLRCAQALNKLGQATGVFIPVAPLCLEVLQWGDLARAPKPVPGEKSPEVAMQLRAGKSALRSATYQEEIVDTALSALSDHLAQWSCHVAFPELAHLTLVQLRRFAKSTSVEKFGRAARQLADATERSIALVGRSRDRASFAPKDIVQAANFLKDEANAGSSAVAQHAATLRERAAQRAALRRAEDVEVGAELPGSVPARLAEREQEDNSSDREDDAQMLQNGLKLPKSKKQQVKRSLEEEHVQKDEENTKGAVPTSKQKKKRAKGAYAAPKAFGDEIGGDEDELGAFELSDLEEDDEGAARPRGKTSAGKGEFTRGTKQSAFGKLSGKGEKGTMNSKKGMKFRKNTK